MLPQTEKARNEESTGRLRSVCFEIFRVILDPREHLCVLLPLRVISDPRKHLRLLFRPS